MDTTDILLVTAAKMGFPESQFLIESFHSTFKFDRNENGRRILYGRKDIPVKLQSHDFPSTEIFFVEIV